MERHGFSLDFGPQHARTLVLFYGLSASSKPQTNFSPKACLPEFESGPNPISGTGLVPIGILVSGAKHPPHSGHTGGMFACAAAK